MSAAIGNVPLLEGRREWSWFFGVAALLLTLHLGWTYRTYHEFIRKPFYYTRGVVLEAVVKGTGRQAYRNLKIRTDGGLTLWTRSTRREELWGHRIRLQLFPTEKISFWRYLKGPYIASRIKEVGPVADTIHGRLGRWIAGQHRSPEAAAFYRSIFLADPLPRELHKKIAALGVSHLVALSGFHLGILWGGLFLLLRPLYRFVQRRFFPWRYDWLDLGSLSLILLAGYLWLTGVPPSLLRAYTMLLFGWGALLLGIEIVSFSFLLVTGVVLTVLFPGLLLSWGFWLSMSGVFFIFLFLNYLGHLSAHVFTLLIIPFGIYLLMAPVTHVLFAEANPWQNLSPILSLLFIPFYPLAILLHLFGWGGLLDGGLIWLWHLPSGASCLRQLPLWLLPLYGGTALAAMRYRGAFYGLLGMAGVSLGWVMAGC